MKIKRIFAPDMRQAIRRVREEHGPDAVILSSKSVTGGVEVISAIDFDQAAVEAALAEQRADEGLRRERRGRRREQAATQPNPSGPPSFAQTLASVRQAPAADRQSAVMGQRIDLAVDDALEAELERSMQAALHFDQAPTAGAGAAGQARSGAQDAAVRRSPLMDVEWSQEPALREMRSELKTLRSLFENQLSVLEWERHAQRHPTRMLLLRELSQMGFATDVCRKISERVAENTPPELGLRHALAMIARHLRCGDEALLDGGGVVAVVGPTGVGKTTTVAKLAARFALRHGRQQVALVSTDNFRIGALEQLRNFGRIMGVGVQTAGSREELAAVLMELRGKRLVLIDTAGMSQRDLRLAEQFRTLDQRDAPIRSYLVVSANTQMPALNEAARAFRGVGLSGCVITKVDEAASLGGVLSMVLRQRLPVAYLGTGQRVPEDLQPARADRLVQQAYTLAQRYAQPPDDDALAFAFAGQIPG